MKRADAHALLFDVYEVTPRTLKRSDRPVCSIKITKADLGVSSWQIGAPPYYTERCRRAVRRLCGTKLSPAKYFHLIETGAE